MQPEHFVSIIGLMFAIVVTLVGWIGNRLHRKMDTLGDTLDTHRVSIGERVAKVENSIDHVENSMDHIEHRLGRIEAKVS